MTFTSEPFTMRGGLARFANAIYEHWHALMGLSTSFTRRPGPMDGRHVWPFNIDAGQSHEAPALRSQIGVVPQRYAPNASALQPKRNRLCGEPSDALPSGHAAVAAFPISQRSRRKHYRPNDGTR